jgi:hypothetical protein
MSWYKSILLLSVLGMTWTECDRHPRTHTRAVPDATLDSASTNAALAPRGWRSPVVSFAGGSLSFDMAHTAETGHEAMTR